VKHVLFLRHGAVERAANVYDDESLVLLTAAGRAQVCARAEMVRRFDPDCVAVSTVTRCVETFEIVTRGQGGHASVAFDERLRERAFGSLFGKSFSEIAERHGAAIAGLVRSNSELVDLVGEESLPDAQARVVAAVTEHARRCQARLLVVSHGGPHSWLVCWMLGASLAGLRKVHIGEARTSLFEFTDDGEPARIVCLNGEGPPLGGAKASESQAGRCR
jgi:probable phosphoglycerate mutase